MKFLLPAIPWYALVVPCMSSGDMPGGIHGHFSQKIIMQNPQAIPVNLSEASPVDLPYEALAVSDDTALNRMLRAYYDTTNPNPDTNDLQPTQHVNDQADQQNDHYLEVQWFVNFITNYQRLYPHDPFTLPDMTRLSELLNSNANLFRINSALNLEKSRVHWTDYCTDPGVRPYTYANLLGQPTRVRDVVCDFINELAQSISPRLQAVGADFKTYFCPSDPCP